MMTRITELDRQIADANEKLKLAQQVISPYDGEVLEIQASSGSTVAEGQPIVSIQPRQQTLELVAYIPSLLAKNVRTDMDAEISPSNIKREEFGFIRGRVNFVADYPSTQAAMMRNFANDAFTRTLMESGPVTEIHASFQDDPTTRSGFRWSTSKGPDVPITSGTICQVDVVTKREKPISLALPYLKSIMGL
jgi:HlyD family secretion protein